MNENNLGGQPSSQQQSLGDVQVQGDDNIFNVIQARQLTLTQTKIVQISMDEIKTRELNTTSPYKGLKKFEPEDVERFFGRDQFLAGLVNELEQTNLILLLGASGSGKSSVVRAGLIPWLQQKWGKHLVSLMLSPDRDPFESLYGSLLSRGFNQSQAQVAKTAKADTLSQIVKTLKSPESFWLLFIDQFEELFTVSEGEKRDRFLEGLVKLSEEQADNPLIKIVGTMRADFLDRLDPSPANRLAKLTQQHRPLITQMQPDELRLAIEQPAAQHGVVFETGLVEEIIKEVQGQAGYLPLLQYTLDLLWETEVQDGGILGRTLNISSYRQIGGARGALQQRVEQIYQALSQPEQLATRRIFLKLVQIGTDESAGTDWKPFRRRANRAEFQDEQEQTVLTQLIDQNLLVSDALVQAAGAAPEFTVEIAHEILLTSWTNLNDWIRQNREAIALRNRLNDDVKQWKMTQSDDELWSGRKLKKVVELKEDRDFIEVLGGLDSDANEFIDASMGLINRKIQEQKQRELKTRIAAKDERRAPLMTLLEACTVKLSIPNQAGANTGFFVAPGKILTCAPEIMKAGEQPITVSWQDQEKSNVNEAKIARLFQSDNLALLQLKSPHSNHPCVYLDKTFRVDDPFCTYGYSDTLAKGGYGVGKCQKQTGQNRHLIEFETYQNSLELKSSPLLNWKTLKVCGIVQSTHDRVQSAPDRYDDITVGKATSAATILAAVEELKKEQRAFHKKDRRWGNLLPARCKPRTVALISIGITGLVVLARFLRLLQSLELGFYDHLIQLRLNPKPNDKVLVIAVTDKDIDAQREAKESVIGSFSNETLTKVLEQVERLEPVAVGLDIYRDNAPLDRSRERKLKQYFEAEDFNLFTICKTPYMDTEVAPPPYTHPERVAFSDFSVDSDGTIRRYTLAYNASKNKEASSESKCTTNFSLGLLLANQYLKEHGIGLENLKNNTIRTPLTSPEYCLKFTDDRGHEVIFPNFQRYMGGYQNVQNSTRCQMLINYQRKKPIEYSSENITNAEAITVENFLDGNFPLENYQNRIVLIGSFAYNTTRDYWKTPYTSSAGGDMPGVVIHAQIVNQIIDSVLPESGRRFLIWVLPQLRGIQWGDFLWIWAWSLAGGFLVWWWRAPRRAVMAMAAACASAYIICFLIFQLSGGWFPFIPVIVVMTLTGALVYWLNWRSAARNVVEKLKHNPRS